MSNVTQNQYICLGVDPGSSSGAISIIKGSNLQYYGIGKLTEKQVERVFYEVIMEQGFQIGMFAVIERVGPMRGQGLSSTFKFGVNYGFLRGCLVANRIPFRDVTPKMWQKHYSMVKKKNESTKDWKRRLWNISTNLYPGADIPLYAADSALISHYAKHLITGKYEQ